MKNNDTLLDVFFLVFCRLQLVKLLPLKCLVSLYRGTTGSSDNVVSTSKTALNSSGETGPSGGSRNDVGALADNGSHRAGDDVFLPLMSTMASRGIGGPAGRQQDIRNRRLSGGGCGAVVRRSSVIQVRLGD